MSELEALEIKQRELHQKVWDLREKERQVQMLALVGKFFKYRNCYSCPEKPSDYWYLYGAFLRIRSTVYSVHFQTDKDGEFSINQRTERYPLSGWQEISKREYFAALKKAEKRIAGLKNMAMKACAR